MYTEYLSVSDYVTRFYRVQMNGSWLTIRDSKTNEVIAERRADDNAETDNWYDKAHCRVVRAQQELETAIFALVDGN